MADNVLETVQRLIQDVIAPDVRELKVRLSALEKSFDERFSSLGRSVDERFSSLGRSVDERFASLERENDAHFKAIDERFTSLEKSMGERFSSLERQSEAQFKALLAAIGESRAQSELASTRGLAALTERVAALEARRQ